MEEAWSTFHDCTALEVLSHVWAGPRVRQLFSEGSYVLCERDLVRSCFMMKNKFCLSYIPKVAFVYRASTYVEFKLRTPFWCTLTVWRTRLFSWFKTYFKFLGNFDLNRYQIIIFDGTKTKRFKNMPKLKLAVNLFKLAFGVNIPRFKINVKDVNSAHSIDKREKSRSYNTQKYEFAFYLA